MKTFKVDNIKIRDGHCDLDWDEAYEIVIEDNDVNDIDDKDEIEEYISEYISDDLDVSVISFSYKEIRNPEELFPILELICSSGDICTEIAKHLVANYSTQLKELGFDDEKFDLDDFLYRNFTFDVEEGGY